VTPDAIPIQEVQSGLRAGLPFIGVASLVLMAGLASLVISISRSQDRLLLWLGTFSALYGIRLFAENELLRRAAGASQGTMLIWTLCLTSVIPIPYGLFARELLGPGWKKSISIWLWIEVAYAVTAVPLVLLGRYFYTLNLVNSILVIAGTLLLLGHLILKRGGPTPLIKGLTWPLAIFGIFVLIKNQGIRPAGIDIEPFGFLILLAGLGFTAIRFALARDRQFFEVEQELKMATRIQNSIIPTSAPELAGMRLAMCYQPMTSVAGDFFDFLKIGENGLTVLVADVSGHGVPAALVASMLKVSFAAQQNQAKDPAKILAGLNTMLRGSLGGQYVTAACAAIDLEANLITYAGAGHPPSLLLRSKSCEVIELAENGLFLGPFPKATYSNMTATIHSGDKLLLYTDGIVEATAPDGTEFGRANLQRFLQENHSLEPNDFIAQLFRRIASPAQQDDLTAVLIQFGK
jgi:sigma-B regulation protein RsbU (phosphoserine phosphatase)